MRVLVNIRGCNGSGKSTIPMSMKDDPKAYTIKGTVEGKPVTLLTVFPKYNWLALGKYETKTGGMDTFPNKVVTEAALYCALDKYPDYDVLMEGVIASTIFSTYSDLFAQISKQYPIKVIVLSLVTPLDICLKRIQERNGGKPIKEDAVASKWHTVDRNSHKFKDAGFCSIRVDSSKVPKSQVLKAFFKTVEKYRED